MAEKLKIPLLTGDVATQVDLTIDGADEVSPEFYLIKGGGAALLREKIVAESSRRLVIVIDESKLSSTLGIRAPVPVEVVQFGWRRQAAYLQTLGVDVTLRAHPGGAPFVTDQGNFILDCAIGRILNPGTLAANIRARAGIVEHGMFLKINAPVFVVAHIVWGAALATILMGSICRVSCRNRHTLDVVTLSDADGSRNLMPLPVRSFLLVEVAG